MEPGRPRSPLLTLGVCAETAESAALWQALHREATLPLATDPARPPAAPWCAVRIELGALPYLETMAWVGDFERCLAWAWIDIVNAR